MKCPACGATIPHDQRFAVLTVCEHCNSAIIYDQEAARVAGKMAVLADPRGPLRVGARGQVAGGSPFVVLGRVRYAYEQGVWDEWYLQHSDQSTSWLSEDERSFVQEQSRQLNAAPSALRALELGQKLDIDQIQYSVVELGHAVCEGGQGQLPFPIVSGERIPFWDLAGPEGQSATLEIEEGERVRFFTGRPVDPSSLRVDSSVSPDRSDLERREENASGLAAKAGPSEPVGRLSPSSTRGFSLRCGQCGSRNANIHLGDKAVSCSHCGASLEVPPSAQDCLSCGATVPEWTPDAKTVVCSYCGSSMSMEGPKPSLLSKLREDEKKRREEFQLPLRVGDRGTFDELEFTIVGYLRYQEEDEDGVYVSDEYLLYQPEWGYRWLVSYNNHWTIQVKLDGTPQITPDQLRSFDYRQHVSALNRDWQFYESGFGRIDWVEGELPWVAKRGDESSYVELTSPPELLVCERTEREIEWSRFRYLDRKELARAFGKARSDFLKGNGVHACQPYTKKAYRRTAIALCLCFAGATIGLGFSNPGRKIAHLSADSFQYKSEHLTSTFEIAQENGIYRIDFSSPVDNSWVSLNWAIVQENGKALIESATDISYYHGYDDGNWSEGSTEESVYVKLPPGEFQFLLLGNAGYGETAVNVDSGKPVTIEIYGDVWQRSFLGGFVAIAILLAIGHAFLSLVFSARRWAHVEGDSD